MKRLLSVAALTSAMSANAHAQVLLATDNFNGEAGGLTVLNYASFANWNVSGTVDLIRSGDAGITCAGGSGSCVDLDGSTGTPGEIISKSAFAFDAGDAVTIRFNASGSQRSSVSDFLLFTLNFTTPTTWSSYSADFAGNTFGSVVPLFVGSGFGTGRNIGGSEGWSGYIFTFIATNAGSFRLSLGTTSGDNIGPVIDNVGITKLGSTVVPEPGTYALMLTGLALLGGVARRRKAQA